MLFENAPTSFNGIVLTLVERIDFNLDETGGLLLLRGQGISPLLETIDNKVTRFIGTAKIQV